MDQISSDVSMLGPADGITVWVVGILVTLKTLANATGGAYSVFEDIVPPGASPPTHVHTREEETWYMLDGELTWNVGSKSFLATKGCYIKLPRNVPHSFINLSDKNAHMLLTYTPGGLEQWFVEVGELVSDRYAPGEPPAMTPYLIEKAIKLGKGYGVIFHDPEAKDEL